MSGFGGRSSVEPCQAGNGAAFKLFGRVAKQSSHLRLNLLMSLGKATLPVKLSDMTEEQRELACKLHAEAVANGQLKYVDPFSTTPEGEPKLVSTELRHQERGYCCRSGCRHCPYGYND